MRACRRHRLHDGAEALVEDEMPSYGRLHDCPEMLADLSLLLRLMKAALMAHCALIFLVVVSERMFHTSLNAAFGRETSHALFRACLDEPRDSSLSPHRWVPLLSTTF